ncbi:MAG: hypothetical protein K2G19_07945, partial [Lachnospiraceae bacterium]|nr:hypothetical protein [Lachnospiraceae bacterium]
MRNKIFKLLAVTVVMATLICGCQKEPESTADGAVRHAKDTVENEVAGIVGGNPAGAENNRQDIDCLIGTEDNGMRIQAQMPEIPQNVYRMVLKENETLTKELLADFLESDTGNISDLSEEASREAEQSEKDNAQGEDRAVYSVFGSGIIYELSAGQKTAVFSHGTSAYYQDDALYEKCISIYKSVKESVLKKTDYTDIYKEAEELLSGRLSKIGVKEIYIYKITQYQSESATFYEIEFTPSYDGMG